MTYVRHLTGVPLGVALGGCGRDLISEVTVVGYRRVIMEEIAAAPSV